MTPRAGNQSSTQCCSDRPKDKTTALDAQVVIVGSAVETHKKEWLTPRAVEVESDPKFVERTGDRGEHCHPNLTGQVKSELWQTPDVGSVEGGRTARGQSEPHKASLEKQTQHGQVKATGKLNPRWVECLMGVPVGWVKCEDGNRTDELRALGNGVVPATAEKAFRTLAPLS
jgi:site-specific DNA-cytosine methylase